MLTKLADEIHAVSEEIANLHPRGRIEPGMMDYLSRTRLLLRNRILRTSEEARVTIQVYDSAFSGLSIEGQSGVFRDFLIKAPSMFNRLGEQLGALQHIVSFWRYRLAPGSSPIGAAELVDILMDFEAGLLGYGENADGHFVAA